MSDKQNNIHNLADYRREQAESLGHTYVAQEGEDLHITLTGPFIEDIKDSALADGADLPQFINKALALGIAESRMLREGWEGPIWEHKAEVAPRGRIGTLLARIGLLPLIKTEYVKTPRPF